MARNVLFLAASEMIRTKKEVKRLSEDTVDATVKTKFVPAVLGTISGFFFKAEGETKFGRFTIDFLVRPNEIMDLDEMMSMGHWSGWDEESSRAAAAHLN